MMQFDSERVRLRVDNDARIDDLSEQIDTLVGQLQQAHETGRTTPSIYQSMSNIQADVIGETALEMDHDQRNLDYKSPLGNYERLHAEASPNTDQQQRQI